MALAPIFLFRRRTSSLLVPEEAPGDSDRRKTQIGGKPLLWAFVFYCVMALVNRIQLPPLELLRSLLHERRRRHGFTYDKLARISGVSRRTIISVEQGDSTGSLETWYRLARALKVGFDEVFALTVAHASSQAASSQAASSQDVSSPGARFEHARYQLSPS